MPVEPSHHESCIVPVGQDLTDVCLHVEVGHRADGSGCTTVRFPEGKALSAEAGNPDLGFDEAHTILHDIVHVLLCCLAGLERSPVLERVVELRPLTQREVDLEEAAAFAIHAFTQAQQGIDPSAAIANVRTALDRLEAPQ